MIGSAPNRGGPDGRAGRVRLGMDEARYRQACRIFEQVCDEPVERRGGRLDALCADDPELRALVERMVEADAETSSDLDTGAAGNLAGALAQDMARTGSLLVPDAQEMPERLGEFRVLRQLGSGGMGVVYEAEQEHPRRRVAIKVIHSWLRTPAFRTRFDWEVEVLGRLLHPGIPQVYQAGLDDDRPYLVMELVEGEALSSWLASRRVGLRRRAELIAAIAGAVHHAHERGIVHCDLKPANVLITPSGAPKVLDFGIAAPAQLASASDHPPLGTPAYMSPEQLRGAAFDARSDVFALGVVAYETFYGRLPFPAGRGGREEALAAIEAGPPVPPRRRGLLRRDLDAVCRRALALRAGDRYPTAGVFGQDLERALAHRPVAARPAGRAYRLRCFLVRRRAVLLAVAGALLVALLFAVAVDAARRHAAESERSAAESAAQARLAATLAQVEQRLDAGDDAGAATAFRAFADEPANQGTLALPAGWLEYGRRLDAAGRDGPAQEAFARASVGTPDVEIHRRALQGLAAAFRRHWDWPALGAALRALAADRVDGPIVRRWQAEHAAAARDLSGAATLFESLGDPVAPLLRALAPSRALGMQPETIDRLDLDGDGRDELLAWCHIGHTVRVYEPLPEFRLSATLRFPEEVTQPTRIWAVPGSPPLLVVQHDGPGHTAGPVRLYALEPAQLAGAPLRTLWEGDIGKLLAVHAVDLEQDGRKELYLGTGPYTRQLLRLEPDDEGRWSVTHPHPRTDAIASDLLALASADTDGDARPELWVGAAAWRAYDVRALVPDAPGTLRRDARSRLGVVTSLIPEEYAAGPDALLAVVSARYPSVVQFGPESPYAAPAGLYRLRREAGRLETRAVVLFERPRAPVWNDDWTATAVGDFDGDGRRDLALVVELESGRSGLLLRGLPDGGFAGVLLGNLAPLAAAQLDDDPADELIVRLADRDEEAWALGLGDGRLPRWAGADVESGVQRPRLPAGELFRRPAELVDMGLVDLAAELLGGTADVERDPQRAAEAELWAAALELAAGRRERAAERLARVAAERLMTREARVERARLLARLQCWSEAVAAFEALRADPDSAPELRAESDAALAWLRPQLGAVPTVALAFDRPLDPAWRIVEPLSVRRDARRAQLALDAYGGGTDLAVLTVRLTGPRLVLRGRLTVAAGELGAGIAIRLRSPRDPEVARLGVWLTYSGGGGLMDRVLRCEPPGRDGLVQDLRAVGTNDVAETIDFEIVHIPALRETRCVLRSSAADKVRESAGTWDFVLPDGDWELALVAAGDGQYGAAIPLAAALEQLSLEGAVVVDRPAPAAPLALVDGDPAAALRLYGSGDPVARTVALLELGRTNEAAQAALEARLAGGPRFFHLLRHTDPALTAPLLERLGAAFLEDYERTWRQSLLDRSHPTAWRSLAAVPADAIPGDTPAQRNLLLCRAQAAWDAGQPAAAADQLARILERAGPDDLATVLEAHLLRAELAMVAGRPGEAEAEARRFVELSPSPEEAGDRLRREPLLAGLNAARAGE
jgi:hypothetical protein